MKKIILFLISIFLLTGCTTKTTNKEITFWTLQMGDFAPYINKIIANYESSHPEVKIKWIDVPFSEGEKRTLAAVMTNNPPDLINLNPDFSAMLAQKGTLWEIQDENLKSYTPDIIQALKYNGKNYSVPWYATSAITIYNKDLFNKSGLIRLPKTYEELASVSEIIKTKTGAYSYLPTITENDTMLKILNKYGISNVEDFNSKQSIQVFEMFKKLYQKDLIPPETITMTHREALEQFMAGKTVFYQGGANFLNMIKENAPKIYAQTDVAEQFKGSVGQNDFSLMNFVIPLRAKNKKEALDFCLYLTNEENQLELAKLTNIIATNSNTLNDKFYNDSSDLISKARSISAKQIQKISPALKQKEGQKEINLRVNIAVQEILLNKDKTENILNNLTKNLSR
ncbi:extracellular solute-binding protein [bacterium]|nr:extracellular solute-binding protein [bacterium]